MAEGPGQAVTPRLLRGWPLPEPSEDGDKHERGTVVVVGGATSTPGAVLLTGLAALRVGAGRLSVATVDATAVALGVALPEAAVLALPVGPGGSLDAACSAQVVSACARAAAVVLGPGLSGEKEARALLEAVLPELPDTTSVVLDAVALTALAGSPALVAPLAGRLVMTPNAGELAALDGADRKADPKAEDPRTRVHAVADGYGAVVASRGWVAAPGGSCWRNEAGGVGLGTSGSGDVLAGAVGGLLARGADPTQAAVWGQYAHAAAGDRLTARLGRTGFLARELLDELPLVVAGLRP